MLGIAQRSQPRRATAIFNSIFEATRLLLDLYLYMCIETFSSGSTHAARAPTPTRARVRVLSWTVENVFRFDQSWRLPLPVNQL